MYQMPQGFNIPSATQPPKSSFVKRFQSDTQKYLTGNRIYNGFSPSPHAGGGLDKAGYAERDSIANATRKNLLQQLSKKGTL
jgi:hypothetical protein